MAAPFKSSLRSSSRRNNNYVDHPESVTIGHRGPPPSLTPRSPPLPPPPPSPHLATSSYLGKRARDAPQTNGVFKSLKRHKVEVHYTSRPKLPTKDNPQDSKKHFANTAAPHHLARESRGGRVTSAVQPPADGTIVPNSFSRPERVNGDSNPVATSQSFPGNITQAAEVDKRTLRSQDGGSRSKSELSLYFPNYEELISKEPKEIELLSAETRLFITEEPPKSPIATKTFILPSPIEASPTKRLTSPTSPRPPPSSVTISQRVDFSKLIAGLPVQDSDPLPSPLFQKAHRRAERQEKQLRNIEKERAQHEKVQLERLHDGLRGPDWLRVMGISGVTEGERKTWEGKRAWCIREVSALIEKFRVWKEEERRRKIERELTTQDEEEDNEDAEDEYDSDNNDYDSEPLTSRKAASSKRPSSRRHLRSPSSSDVDALAALQLHNETLSASAQKSKQKPRGKPGPKPKLKFPPDRPQGKGNVIIHSTGSYSTGRAPPTSPPSSYHHRRTSLLATDMPIDDDPIPHKPLTSFFKKAHQRAAALDRNRRSGRVQLAFGQPIPEMEERPFELPAEWITDEARRAAARGRRSKRRKGREG